MNNAVANKKNAELSTDVMDLINESTGEGTVFDSSELQIPFIRLIQAMSPQLSKKKAEYIEGASQGDAFNTVTKERWDGETGLTVVPCYQTTKYLEFVPRESGGGFQGEISPGDPVISKTTRNGAKEILPNGNEMVKSDQHFCLVIGEDGSTQPAIIDMKSTQLKVSKRWKTMIAMERTVETKNGPKKPDCYTVRWKLSSIEQSNDKGTFANWQVERLGYVETREQILEAKAFRESVKAGEVKAAPEESSSSSDNGDDIPF
jgi:hypothetical protein